MKANRKFKDDDSGVATVVSTILLIAIIVPMMTLIIMTFTSMSQKQIEMMDTTVAIMDEFVSQIQIRSGYDMVSGNGMIFNSTYGVGSNNYSYSLILHFHEIDYDNDTKYNVSAYFPVETLPPEYEKHNLSVSFKVNRISTYFHKFIPKTIDITIPDYIPDVDHNNQTVKVSLVEVIDLTKRY